MEINNNLKIKYDVCKNALETLMNAIELLQNTNEVEREQEYLAFQDSVIKRFEYSIDIDVEIYKRVSCGKNGCCS
jgi:hypothetical protein